MKQMPLHLKIFQKKQIIRMLVVYGLILIVCWGVRIVHINTLKPDVTEIAQRTVYHTEDLNCEIVETGIYDIKSFEEKFRVNLSVQFGGDGQTEDKLLCCKMYISNHSGRDIAWEEVVDPLSCGFESVTWFSAVDSYITSQLNSFQEECMREGASQSVWFVTTLGRSCFRDATWENLKIDDFWYVSSLSPKIMFQL